MDAMAYQYGQSFGSRKTILIMNLPSDEVVQKINDVQEDLLSDDSFIRRYLTASLVLPNNDILLCFENRKGYWKVHNTKLTIIPIPDDSRELARTIQTIERSSFIGSMQVLPENKLLIISFDCNIDESIESLAHAPLIIPR
jgi:hypothetical protein